MSFNSKTLPENIRRRMQPEERKAMDIPTQPEADARFSTKREKELQNQIANLLRQRGIVFFQQRMDKRTTGKVGQPDFIFAVNGKACAVECKVGNAALTDAQVYTQGDLLANQWDYFIARSLEEFRDWLNGIQKEVNG